jgi:IS30 family transposase
MRYHQITLDERIAISTLRKEGLCPAAIARRLGRHRSTISRELQRNSCAYDGNYRFTKAQRRTNGRRWRTRRGLQHTTEQYRCVEGLVGQEVQP